MQDWSSNAKPLLLLSNPSTYFVSRIERIFTFVADRSTCVSPLSLSLSLSQSLSLFLSLSIDILFLLHTRDSNVGLWIWQKCGHNHWAQGIRITQKTHTYLLSSVHSGPLNTVSCSVSGRQKFFISYGTC